MRLDVSLDHEALYQGLEVEVRAGRKVLLTPPEAAVSVLGESLGRLEIDPEEVVLTGAMSIWAYLVVFHHLHGCTKRIWYEDGRGQKVLVAAHG